MKKEKLLGKTLLELQEVCLNQGFPKFTATQVCSWVYKQRVTTIDQMHNISKKARAFFDANYEVGASEPITSQTSIDGTKKYLFKVEGHYVEAVMIPDGDRKTVCVSTQVGCRMGCKFCVTGKMGFHANLSSNEIINQVYSIPESDSITNIVYMGMGEPLDNYDEVIKSLEILTAHYAFMMSPRRITVSTIGVIPEMLRFLAESNCHLAVSLHSPFDEERLQLMPIQKKYPISEIISALRKVEFDHQRRLSFEYIILEGINDSPVHVKGLTTLLNGLSCRINVIRFHKTEGEEWHSPDDIQVIRFVDQLNAKGITTTLRSSRGEDIMAACGLLSTSKEEDK